MIGASERLRPADSGDGPPRPAETQILAVISPEERQAVLRRDVQEGFAARPFSLPPVWFYDDYGSRLFEEITRLPEYYPTRTESEILSGYAPDIVALSEADTLVELGSGVSEKTRLLLNEMARVERLCHFVPLDVSEETLRLAALDIHEEYGVPVTGVVGDFREHLGALPRHGKRLVCFLGGTIGNLTPAARRRFFLDLEATMSHDDWLLLGTDLVKDTGRLVRAYDDAAGVTAEFNKNVLRVLNRELGAGFDLEAFSHVALWNEADRCIEMRLRSRRRQVVEIAALGLSVSFDKGEEILTEISSKFSKEAIAEELVAANFVVEATFTDAASDFLLTLAHPYC